MLDYSRVENYYIACGYTDMRKQIDGLAAIVELQFGKKLDETAVFLFCGHRADRIKAALLGWHRVCAAVQTPGRETVPVAAKQTGAEAADKTGTKIV